LTTALRASGQKVSSSAAVVSSPVTSTTGTPNPKATRELIPLSPATWPLKRTSAMASGL